MIDGKTKILGVMGDPIEHTFSPAMHNAGLKELGMNYIYLPFHVKPERLSFAIDGAKALGIQGFNVTIPHKTNVMKHLNQIDQVASMIGAVNTIQFIYDEDIESSNQDNEINVTTKGFNTDGYGCVRAIEEKTSIKNKKVTITGAGGASRAVAFQIASSGIEELSLLNRNLSKAESLVADLKTNLASIGIDIGINAYGIDDLKRELSDSDIFIDTTPIGMYPNVDDKAIASADMFHEDLLVNDIVYTPMETSLIKEAKLANATVVPGYKMLLYQGIRSFEIWLGREAPVDVMEKALLDVLGI
ncbi:shikimate dehydrogenase [uncultured Methanobrevibacter sp.]|uniref:shikimate dehydrogenase n=1 Tax=uncultured Methanobrevibacter sp. TaxID=253161 RepID=UPI0025D40D1E|nr:shikimate dehydrogenase [uncultured Methanobrevibacter sp.]